jgi:hypothetical protein
MSLRKITKKEWIKKGLPESVMFVGPYYKWNNEKKNFNKPIVIVTQKLAPKKENK